MKSEILQPSTDSLKALSRIAQTVSCIQEIEPLLKKILEIAIQMLTAERGFVLLKSGINEKGFVVKSSSNLTEAQITSLTGVSTSVAAQVMASGESIIVSDADIDPKYRKNDSIILQKIQSIACVALNVNSQNIGIIYLDSLTRNSKFTEEILPFLTAFSNQAAIAIENLRLVQLLREENNCLRIEIQRGQELGEIIGQSAQMQKVFDVIKQVADSDISVLVEGDSGTGKELVARALHTNSQRKDKPFMALVCGSLPDSLLESELFGHKRGAFTGAVTDKKGLLEAADGGTFFLDEIGVLSAQIQTKLLRVLQEGEIKRIGENRVRKVDVRIVSATNKKLTDLIESGDFDEDLYNRLNTISVTLPPLCDRVSDVPLLAHHFLDKYAKKKQQKITGFSETAIDAMLTYNWPGNVRELENTIERAVILAREELITPTDLRLPEINKSTASLETETATTLREIQENAVKKALKKHDGNIPEAARTLEVSRRWLQYKVKEWGL